MSKIGENGAINCTTMRTAALVGTESPGGLGSTRRQLRFRAGDRSGAGRREESNEISNFSGLGWATNWNPARESHQALLRGRVVRAAGFRQSRKSRPRQRQLPLNRGDVDDDARAPLKHLRQQRPIQPHRWKQILVERPLPFDVIECGESSAGNGRTADDMNNDVDSASYSVTASTTAAQPSAVAISAATNKSSGASVSGRARADASTLAPPSRIAPLQLRRFPSCRPSRACASRQGRGRHASPDLQGADSVISRQAETVG